jgi:hypothetical protein
MNEIAANGSPRARFYPLTEGRAIAVEPAAVPRSE